MKVAVYAIALDERAHVERFLSSAAGADVVVVADTGSTDGTVEALRAGGATVHVVSIRPWRFDDARNAALALVPADVDVCVPLDLDEVLAPGWRRHLEAGWGGATRGRSTYVWSHLPDGTPGTVFRSDRIHARHGYRWLHPCHEIVVPDRIEEVVVDLDVEVHHWPDDTKGRSQYLPLLEIAVAERPHDPRMSHYLGRELMFQEQHERAVAELRRHLSLPAAVWDAERAASMRYIGGALMRLGRVEEALDSFVAATLAHPTSREPWIELAQACHDASRWSECRSAAERALEVVERDGGYLTEPWAWGERAHDLAGVAAWHLGDLDGALAHTARAAAMAPGDERIAANLAWLRAAVAPPGGP